MRLATVRTRDSVADDANAPVSHFTEKAGYLLSLDAGIVTILGPKLEMGRLVPISNVLFMTPAPTEKKAGK